MTSTYTETVWPYWITNSNLPTMTTVCSTNSNCVTPSATNVWPYWVTSATTTATTFSQQVWQAWVFTSNSVTSYAPATFGVWQNWAELTAEEREALEKAQRRRQEQFEEQSRKLEEERKEKEDKRKKAVAQAKQLLLNLLDEEQEKAYTEKGAFELRTDRAKYRIRPGERVEELGGPEEKVVARLCIHPPDYQMPVEDWAIAQKLMLETDEETFIKIANRSAA